MATMVLADMGAEVIKIERPGSGDDTRSWGPPFVGSDAAYFFSINRNKKSIALDLKDPSDLKTAKDIAARADVVVENFRAGGMDGLGLGYETVRDMNPGVVYCSMPAFTSDDHRELPGYDLMMQAVTGFMSITGDDGGGPVKMGVAILDVVAGLHAAAAIAAALSRRAVHGVGAKVEVGLFEASVAALINQASNYLLGGLIPEAHGTAHPNIVPYQAFQASDGSFVMAAAGDRRFRSACHAIGRSDLAEDPRYATNAGRLEGREDLIADLSATFAGGSIERWVGALMEAGVPAGPIRTIDQVFASPEGVSMIESVIDPTRGELRLVRSPVSFDGETQDLTAPPVLDADRDAILAWLKPDQG
jgi:crotonobetainyl-CoA:carnitine CoA-transferase CaiB-like acyl-CoA transferase